MMSDRFFNSINLEANFGDQTIYASLGYRLYHNKTRKEIESYLSLFSFIDL